MSTLYVVATPIGNLGDISNRALKTLKGVDLILAEDTRVSQKLLNRFEIKTKTLSYHQHSKLKKINYILGLLKEGKDLALISDAGTPGISDPGNKLIGAIATTPGLEVKIVSVPGPSAITAAASVAGISMAKFLFLGFPPAKRKRKRFFEEISKSKYPVVFYESPYRILKTLNELKELFTTHYSLPTNIVVCQELTKKFETVYRGTIEEVIEKIKEGVIKGEFVVIVENK